MMIIFLAIAYFNTVPSDKSHSAPVWVADWLASGVQRPPCPSLPPDRERTQGNFYDCPHLSTSRRILIFVASFGDSGSRRRQSPKTRGGPCRNGLLWD
jgi:hypothetical protein